MEIKYRFLHIFSFLIMMAFATGALYGEDLSAASDVWTPFFMVSGKQFSGIGYDILMEVADRTGDEITIIHVPNKRAQVMFDEGDIDISVIDSPLWNDPGKADSFVFTDELMTVREYIYFVSEQALLIDDPADLAGRKVGIMDGYYYPPFEDLFDRGFVEKVEVGNESSLIRMLLLKRVDAIFMDTIAFGMTISQLGLDSDRFTRSLILSETALGIKIRAEKSYILPRFNRAISQMREDGSIERIIEKYVSFKRD